MAKTRTESLINSERDLVRTTKHLPFGQWPKQDQLAFEKAFTSADIFDEDGVSGAHLTSGTRCQWRSAYSRWLGFLLRLDPEQKALMPEERITKLHLAGFIDELRLTCRDTTVALVLDGLYQATRLMIPGKDWSWLKTLGKRVQALAIPLDRSAHLQAPHLTLGLGIEMMDVARATEPGPHHISEVAYRDGLVIALLSLWPIRRRSIAALTVDRHVVRQGQKYRLNLFPGDTKSRRAESFVVPEFLAGYFEHYLTAVRLKLIRRHRHDALWVSQRGTPLTAGAIYLIVHKNVRDDHGISMGLHDFRRAAATSLALSNPEMIGLLPGVLQHTNRDMSDRHYNLAGSARASQRYTAVIANYRSEMKKVRE